MSAADLAETEVTDVDSHRATVYYLNIRNCYAFKIMGISDEMVQQVNKRINAYRRKTINHVS